jgi:hypothetical protein
MKPLAKKPSPAATAVLRQATALSPKRRKASDGLLPSLAHIRQNPNSDHNTGLAVDLTHDPHNGIDCGQLYERLKGDKRVSYLIFNSKIWSADNGDRVYAGPNKHTTHLHISIKEKYAKDTSPWFPWLEKKPRTPVQSVKVVVSKASKPKKKAVKKTFKQKSIILSFLRKGK